jgi:hypothetical protein
MANYVVTPANVLASSKAARGTGIAGVTLIAGQSLAKDVDGSVKLFSANAAAPLNVFIGIALHGSLVGQPIIYVISDPNFTPGFAITIGATVIGGATPGSMAPDADKATGWFLTEVGHGISTTQINLQLIPVGVAIP